MCMKVISNKYRLAVHIFMVIFFVFTMLPSSANAQIKETANKDKPKKADCYPHVSSVPSTKIS